MLVLSDVVIIFLSPIVVLTPNGNFWVVPLLHSVSGTFAVLNDNAERSNQQTDEKQSLSQYNVLHLWFPKCAPGIPRDPQTVPTDSVDTFP